MFGLKGNGNKTVERAMEVVVGNLLTTMGEYLD
jgi:hypothetical protein